MAMMPAFYLPMSALIESLYLIPVLSGRKRPKATCQTEAAIRVETYA
ncbi:hypothetical protein CLU90_2071 [Janthinobacterium sp. 67]|nr:hypothetical protein CLU90_2071 [Janthinobacterium sp. 67]